MFKKILVSAMFLAIIVAAGCSEKVLTARPLAVPGHLSSLSEVIDKSEDQMPSKLVVYKVVPYQFDEKAVKEMVAKFGVTGNIQNHDSFYLLENEGKRFTIDKYSGSYSLMSDLPIEEMIQPLKETKSDLDYIEMADKLIADTGIKRDGLVDVPIVYDYRKASYIDDTTGKEVEVTILKGVTYRYKELNGIKIEGVAPRLTIAFNAEGKVVEIMNPWSYFEVYQEYPLMPKSSALSLLQKLDNRHATVQGLDMNDTFTINSMRVVYFNDPIGYEPLYLMPFYCMEGINSKGNAVTAYVRAIDEKYIKVEPSPILEDPSPPIQRTEETYDVEATQGTGNGTSPEGEQAAAAGKKN